MSTQNAWIPAHSAGGVVVRAAGDTAEFIAIKPAGQDRWQLPKGTVDAGETPEQAAIREVREETGAEARIVESLGAVTYFFQSRGRKFRKTVEFFLMAYETGDLAGHDREVDEARWFPLAQADVLTFETEREVVERAKTHNLT